MKDGICPKCNAENVRITKGNRTGLSVPFNSNWSSGALTNFLVCGECGYLEIYVEDKNDLTRINQDWEQVKVRK
jgi:predicted nucleic-acid-binding Zn-ribbon protein